MGPKFRVHAANMADPEASVVHMGRMGMLEMEDEVDERAEELG